MFVCWTVGQTKKKMQYKEATLDLDKSAIHPFVHILITMNIIIIISSTLPKKVQTIGRYSVHSE